MEISHASTETQSAAVGITGKAEEVTVSTDAEFMMMIAHGIYSNKPLALVRELICNGRDGHAKAGDLSKEITVTLTDNSLVVRDYGTGIPNEIFTSTYLTFGKSTKRKDKKATGGFGVGTKVPWAVCDTFSARNFIDGTMTAYTIRKSDPNADGKPTCTAIMTIPSKEPNGLEVTVPFPEKMHRDIENYLRIFGEELNIPIIVNNSPRPRSDYDHDALVKDGFTILPRHPRSVIQQSSFYVRQGDVIYPIEHQEEFSDAYHMLERLNPNARNNPILFMAEPDSIIPTLSRESLQYTERTSLSIRALMVKALKSLADNVDDVAAQVAAILPKIASGREAFVREVWSHQFRASALIHEMPRHIKFPADLPEAGKAMLMNNLFRWLEGSTPYLETKVTLGKDWRLAVLADIERLFQDHLSKYTYLDKARMLEIREAPRGSYRTAATGIQKKVTENFVKELTYFRDLGTVSPIVLDTYYMETDDIEYVTREYATISNYVTYTSELVKNAKDKDKPFSEIASGYGYHDLKNYVYVSKTVIISSAPKIMAQRAIEYFRHRPLENRNPIGGGYICARLKGARCIRLKAQAKEKDIQALKEHLTKAGYDVILLLNPTEKEQRELDQQAAERARLKETPLPTLGKLIEDGLATWPNERYLQNKKKLKHLHQNEAFKGKKMYMITSKGKELSSGMTHIDSYMMLVRLVGTDIVCVSTKPEIAKVVKEGRINVEDVLIELATGFLRRKDIRLKLYFRGSFIAKRYRQNKYLTKYLFGVHVPKMTDEEQKIYEVFGKLSSAFPELARKIKRLTKLFVQPSRISRTFTRLFSKYEQENFCNVDRALDAAYARKSSKSRTLAREIMRKILKEGTK